MPKTVIIDDSPLAEAVASLCGMSKEDVLREDSRAQAAVSDAERVLLHSAHGKGRRRSAFGVELLTRLRRDYRFGGEILLYSLEALDSLAAKHPSLRHLESDEGGWNNRFFQLPQAREELCREATREEVRRLSPDELAEFILRYGHLEEYFSAAWSNTAHWLQGNDWRRRLCEADFRTLLRNTKDFAPLWLARRGTKAAPADASVTSSLRLLKKAAAAADSADEGAVREAIGHVQNWLKGDPLPYATHIEIPTSALEDCSLVLVADDDGYDASGLDALGYHVRLNTKSFAEARAYLEEEAPNIFLCDLRWFGDPRAGIELAEAAVKSGVEIVILMSAGTDFPEELPHGVIKCSGILKKSDATYIHSQIINAYYARKLEPGGESDSSA